MRMIILLAVFLLAFTPPPPPTPRQTPTPTVTPTAIKPSTPAPYPAPPRAVNPVPPISTQSAPAEVPEADAFFLFASGLGLFGIYLRSKRGN
jgi:hypothetical protein